MFDADSVLEGSSQGRVGELKCFQISQTSKFLLFTFVHLHSSYFFCNARLFLSHAKVPKKTNVKNKILQKNFNTI